MVPLSSTSLGTLLEVGYFLQVLLRTILQYICHSDPFLATLCVHKYMYMEHVHLQTAILHVRVHMYMYMYVYTLCENVHAPSNCPNTGHFISLYKYMEGRYASVNKKINLTCTSFILHLRSSVHKRGTAPWTTLPLGGGGGGGGGHSLPQQEDVLAQLPFLLLVLGLQATPVPGARLHHRTDDVLGEEVRVCVRVVGQAQQAPHGHLGGYGRVARGEEDPHQLVQHPVLWGYLHGALWEFSEAGEGGGGEKVLLTRNIAIKWHLPTNHYNHLPESVNTHMHKQQLVSGIRYQVTCDLCIHDNYPLMITIIFLKVWIHADTHLYTYPHVPPPPPHTHTHTAHLHSAPSDLKMTWQRTKVCSCSATVVM